MEKKIKNPKDFVIVKNKKYFIQTQFQHYDSGRVRLRCLNLWDIGIKTLEDIEGLKETNVQSLMLNRNGLSDLEGISELTNLKKLQIGDNIKEIKGLDELTELTHLMIVGEMSEIKGLSHLKSLTHLTLNGEISEIKELNGFTKLHSLDLSGNQISKIKGLDNLENIYGIWRSEYI